MKVVHITTYLHGGAGIAAIRLHLELLNQGIDSHIISLANTTVSQVDNHHPVSVRQTKFHEKVLNKFGIRLNSAYRNAHRLKQLKGEYEIVTFHDTDYRIENIEVIKNADIIHLHWIAGFVNYNSFFKKLANKKIVWTLHDLNPIQGIFHYKNDEIINKSFEDLNSQVFHKKMTAIRSARNLHFICLNSWMKRELNKVMGSNVSSTILPNVVNEKEFYLEEPIVRPNAINLLLIADNINNPRKGIDLVIKSLKKLKHKDKIKIYVAGRGNLVFPRDIEVVPLGSIGDTATLRKVYNQCDYLLLPSREDNLPNTMVEALLCGTAVISFKVGGMTDHILKNVNGFTIVPYDVNQMAEQIDYITENNFTLSKDKISEQAHQTFSQTNIHKYINLYKELMNEKLALQ
ncbi:glycosyltransferase [Pedobacter sp.]